jgi:hypothetical protein
MCDECPEGRGRTIRRIVRRDDECTGRGRGEAESGCRRARAENVQIANADRNQRVIDRARGVRNDDRSTRCSGTTGSAGTAVATVATTCSAVAAITAGATRRWTTSSGTYRLRDDRSRRSLTTGSSRRSVPVDGSGCAGANLT